MEARGKKVKAFEDVPVLEESLEEIWAGFVELSNARASGFSRPCPIAIADLVAWISFNRFSASVRKFVYKAILAMDAVWLEHVTKELETKHANSTSNH